MIYLYAGRSNCTLAAEIIGNRLDGELPKFSPQKIGGGYMQAPKGRQGYKNGCCESYHIQTMQYTNYECYETLASL